MDHCHLCDWSEVESEINEVGYDMDEQEGRVILHGSRGANLHPTRADLWAELMSMQEGELLKEAKGAMEGQNVGVVAVSEEMPTHSQDYVKMHTPQDMDWID